MLYTHKLSVLGGEAILEVLRNAWHRLTHKQLLIAYPLAVGIVNVLAFTAIYSLVSPELNIDRFVRANFERWTFVQEHLQELLVPGLPLIVTLLTGVGVCVLSACIRAPFFRAVVSAGYPLAPRSLSELGRLSVYYGITYLLFYVGPHALKAGSTAFHYVSLAAIPVSLLFVFGDYAVVFEGMGPLAAIRKSVALLRTAWLPALAFYALALLLWSLSTSLYGRYYESSASIFILLPLSQLLVESLITALVDVLLISTYGRFRA